MARRKVVTKRTPRTKIRHGLLPKARKYPFDDLKVAGDYFIVYGTELENSLRVQASKNQKARSVSYTVTRVDRGLVLSDGKKIDQDGMVVRFNGPTD